MAMYEQFFGLHARPFELTPDPRYLFLTQKHAEALAHLEYGLSGRKGVTVLIGEVGTGKTTLLRAALERISGSGVQCAHVANPTLTRDEVLRASVGRIRSERSRRAIESALSHRAETAGPRTTPTRWGDGARRGRGAVAAVRAARRDPAARESRERHRQTDAGRARRSAGARRAIERTAIASAEAAHCAAVHAGCDERTRNGGVHRRTHSNRRRRIRHACSREKRYTRFTNVRRVSRDWSACCATTRS